ncbi:hypothetical protein [Oceanisphaera psychrotolerans]|uniref:hypothetical protein n=1 Tax=Oceanisphaera psychrotolerans TaxID=1414654 RepID=UPI001FE067F6|nr:hypothetical protein [Oceanisphaera psychrotolerans]
MRLAEPAQLALNLGWSLPEYQQTRILPARQPIPVFLVYFTSWVEQGQLVFAKDIYRKNETI